jgi:hypothetical protein
MIYHQKLIILPVRIHGEESTLNITAYEAEGTGLAYHGMRGDEREGWVITHLASKRALCSPIGTEHEVKRFRERVAPIANWSQSEEEFIKHPKIAIEFNKCQQTVAQGLNMELESAMKQSDIPDHMVETVMNELEDDVLRSALLYAFKIVS